MSMAPQLNYIFNWSHNQCISTDAESTSGAAQSLVANISLESLLHLDDDLATWDNFIWEDSHTVLGFFPLFNNQTSRQAFGASSPSLNGSSPLWENTSWCTVRVVFSLASDAKIAEVVTVGLLSKLSTMLSEMALQYQIRFLGFKGIMAIDKQLKGIQLCLRESMNKFKNHGENML
ncbi:hypothetical protein F4604DRAFT_1689901 [Suillus subluteus]|nr:hypothetical protein F4604DRAFT_1689901 [Suillus subluteus]